MNKVKEKFLSVNMTWPKVIVFAVITAVFTAAMMIIPALKDTSFQDIGVNLECWILFAVFIIVNCKKWWEASLKTFVFFLISQPLIYFLQVPFYTRGFALFDYYKPWFIMTVLTLPGAAIAFPVKKKTWLSAAVLSVAAGGVGFMIAKYFWSVRALFPKHLLSLIFCIALEAFLIWVLLDKKEHRIAVCAVVLAVFTVSLIILKPVLKADINLPEGEWTYMLENESVVKLTTKEGRNYTVRPGKEGATMLTFMDENGNIREYYITVHGGGVTVNTFE